MNNTSTQNLNKESKDTEMKAEKKVYTLPENPNKAMQEMMDTINTLRTTMVEETEMLTKADTTSFLNMQDKKIEVTSKYLEGMTQLIARKEELKSADPSLREKLQAMRVEFADITDENLVALDRMKTGMKRLGERIMQQAQKAAKSHDQIIYGSNGHMQSASKASIGINESV